MKTSTQKTNSLTRNKCALTSSLRRSVIEGHDHATELIDRWCAKIGHDHTQICIKSTPRHFGAPDNAAKEPHYLTYASEGRPLWAIKTQEQYESLFDGATSHLIRAEKSTWYLYSEKSAEMAASLLNKPKAIALLRNPIDRAFSAFQFNRQNGWETRSNFLQALEEESTSQHEGPAPDHMYSRAGFYFDGLQRWNLCLGIDNVHTIIFDDLKLNLGNELKSVCAFLDVSEAMAETVDLPPANSTKAVRSPGIVRLKQRFRWTKSLAPAVVTNRLARGIDRMNTRVNKPIICPEAARLLAQRPHDDVSELSELLDRDLISEWLKDHL